MLQLSARQTRWMGLCGVLGGMIWVSDLLYFMPNAPTSPARGYVGLAYSLMLIVGLLGFWVQDRGRLGRVATAGALLVLTSLVSFFLMLFLGTVLGVSGKTLLMNVMGLAFVFLLPPGFILLSIGLRGATRVVPLVIVAGFLAWTFLPRLLAPYYPSAAAWGGRGDSPLGVTFFLLVAVGLAFTGYSVFRDSARGTTPHQAR